MTKLYKIPPLINYEESEIYKDLILQYVNLIGRTPNHAIYIFILIIRNFINYKNITHDIDIKKFNEIFYLFVICDIINDQGDTYEFIIPYISNYYYGYNNANTILSFINFYLYGETPGISKIIHTNDEMKHVPKIVHFLATIKFFNVENTKFGTLLEFINTDSFDVDFMKDKKEVDLIILKYFNKDNTKKFYPKFYNIPDFYKEVFSNIYSSNEHFSSIVLPGVNKYLINIVSILINRNQIHILNNFITNEVRGKEKETILDFLSGKHYNRKIIIYI